MSLRTIEGRYFNARPKRWWWPPDRKVARVGVKVADYHFVQELERRQRNAALSGKQSFRAAP